MCQLVSAPYRFFYPLARRRHNHETARLLQVDISRAHTYSKSRYKLYAVVNKDTHLLTVRPIVLYSFVEEIYPDPQMCVSAWMCECVDVQSPIQEISMSTDENILQ